MKLDALLELPLPPSSSPPQAARVTASRSAVAIDRADFMVVPSLRGGRSRPGDGTPRVRGGRAEAGACRRGGDSWIAPPWRRKEIERYDLGHSFR